MTTDQFTGALLAIEASVHRYGWDQDPSVHTIHRTDTGAPWTQQLPVPDEIWQDTSTTAEALILAATNIVSGNLTVDSPDTIIGWAATTEAWSFPHTDDKLKAAEYDQYIHNGGQIADHLDGVETRLTTGCFIPHGHRLPRWAVVERIRGRQPVPHSNPLRELAVALLHLLAASQSAPPNLPAQP